MDIFNEVVGLCHLCGQRLMKAEAHVRDETGLLWHEACLEYAKTKPVVVAEVEKVVAEVETEVKKAEAEVKKVVHHTASKAAHKTTPKKTEK